MVDTSLIQCRALLARQQLLHQQQHKRLARRIHDDISQQLTLLSLQLSLAQMDAAPPPNWAQTCQQWSAMVLALGQNLRHIINELQPRVLDDLGLVAALQWYAHSRPNGINLKLLLPDQPVVLPPSSASELFAICRDIVTDVFVPNGVKEAGIELEPANDTVRLRLRPSENNPALEPLVSKALDALSLHERLLCMDGSFETRLDQDKGLAITISMPMTRQPVSCAA